jgi:hypothetical protein
LQSSMLVAKSLRSSSVDLRINSHRSSAISPRPSGIQALGSRELATSRVFHDFRRLFASEVSPNCSLRTKKRIGVIRTRSQSSYDGGGVMIEQFSSLSSRAARTVPRSMG